MSEKILNPIQVSKLIWICLKKWWSFNRLWAEWCMVFFDDLDNRIEDHLNKGGKL